METWKKQYISINKYELARSTLVSEQLLLILESKEVLGVSDLQSIRSRREELEKSSVLYDRIQTRVNAYEVLLQALIECNQTGASQLLIEGSTKHPLMNATVTFFGRAVSLQGVFDKHDCLSIQSNLKTTGTVTEYQELLNKITPNFNLLKDTMPPPTPCYIPRRIEKRTNIDPRLFQIKCEDVFVFQGLEFTNLNTIATEPPNKSGRQLMKINTRFVYLEFKEHWDSLKQISTKPIHLITYDVCTDAYILQSTQGRSKILRQFLLKLTDNTIDHNLYLSEGEFIQLCLNSNVVCICDRPGMGKSYLLANIARQVKPETNKVVAFIRLQSLLEFVYAKCYTTTSGKLNEKQILLNFLSTSNLSYAILNQYDQKYGIKLDLFFDGFDEVLDGKWATQFLSKVRLIKDCRIFVTSRPQVQDQLEDALEVLSFNLLPFDENDQIEYIAKLWKSWSDIKDTLKLEKFANVCLSKFCQKMSNGEEALTGIPIQCYLLADVYAEKARAYSNTTNGCVLNEQIIVESQFDVFKLYVTERLRKAADVTERQKVKAFHAWHAFKILFPRIAETYYNLNELSTISNDYSDYLTYGLLEEHHNGTSTVYKFLHRTIAEFLVAMVIGEYVTTGFLNPCHDLVNEFVTFIYEEVILHSYQEKLIFNEFVLKPLYHGYMERKIMRCNHISICSFEHNVVLYFLNFYLQSIPDLSFPKTFRDALRNVRTKEFDEVCKLMKSCVFHNFSQIVKLIEVFISTKQWWFSPRLFRVLNPFVGSELLDILTIAAKYSDVATIQTVVKVLNVFYNLSEKIDVQYEFDLTPVSVALQRGDFPVVSYFLGITEIHSNIEKFWELNLRFCIGQTTSNNTDQISEKKDILELILSELAKVSLKSNEVVREVPPCLVTCGINLTLLKYLVNNQFDICAVNYYRENILHQAANSICPLNEDEFHNLIIYLLSIPEARSLFFRKNETGKTPIFLGVENIRT